MEQFVFTYEDIFEHGGGGLGKRVVAQVIEPVSLQQTIENFFAFLEATGVDALTVESAASEVLMERFNANEFPLFENETDPVEDEGGYGLGV